MSNVNSDLLDDGLRAVMSKDRCQDVTGNARKEQDKTIRQVKPVPKDEAMDAGWVKLNTVSSMAKVRGCAKWTLLFGSISGLLFYWQQAGLLASRAAVPSLIFCALGAGLAIGWHAR